MPAKTNLSTLLWLNVVTAAQLLGSSGEANEDQNTTEGR
jgi:hypothetical protein